MLSQLFESLPDALLVVDGQGCIVLANANAERLFGYDPGELAGLPVEALMPEGVRDRHRQHVAGYMARPRLRLMGQSGMSLVGQRKNGMQFPVDVALSRFRIEAGPRYLASIRDISETQRAQQALVRARYDTVVEHIGQVALAPDSSDAIFDPLPRLLADALNVPTVAVVLANGGESAVRAAVGLPGKRLWSAFASTSLRRMLQAHATQVVPDPAHAPEGWPPQAVSGAVVPLGDQQDAMGALVAMASTPGRFDHDAIQLLQTVANLVAATVRRRLAEEQLAHAQRLDAIGQLVGGIAHDFNNLLTVMSGNLQLLECTHEEPAQAREIIRSALRSVERGSEFTAKLLAFARRQRLSPRAIDPVVLLHDLELLLRRTLGGSVRLRVDCPAGMPGVFADPSQLDSALVNLALNARDAMPQGGEITIDVRKRRVRPDTLRPGHRSGQCVVFRVADTGHGMPADVLARAFEPFFTTKASGHGSGLGLSMVYGFARQSGGQVKIHSRLGQGTRVELFLPVAPAGLVLSPQPKSGCGQGGSETLLVVEDEEEVRQVAANSLRSLGYEVLVASSAEAALEALQANERIALLFSDVMLGGGMNGIELARAARRLRPRLQVLLTSGYEDLGTMAGASADPMPRLLRKPYRREQLARAVRRQLSKRRPSGVP